MYLKCHKRLKDGKEHRYWSIVESYRLPGKKTAKRQVLYLGEINDSQRLAWCRVIEAFEEGSPAPKQIALFPQDREAPAALPPDTLLVQVDLAGLEIHRPRQWGACWLMLMIWRLLGLDGFWQERLAPTRKGTDYYPLLLVHVCNQVIDPGSEWHVLCHWYRQTALSDLLGLHPEVLPKNPYYHCLDLLVEHKDALFRHLQERWNNLFGANCDVLLYDLTSTYFENDPPPEGVASSKKRRGYSRDHRPDCLQVVIAVVMSSDGFPLTYEVFAGNTQDKQTLREMIAKIESQYGKTERIWIMDRGIPTEETLAEMRAATPQVRYIVGTPRGRLSRYEQSFLQKSWKEVRQDITVKLLEEEGELYVLVRSGNRVDKERAMRRRRLKKLWQRLKELAAMEQTRDELLMRLGAARKEAGRAYGLVKIKVPKEKEASSGKGGAAGKVAFEFSLRREKLRQTRRREGKYLIRANLNGPRQPSTEEEIWRYYMLLVEIEEAFKTLKGALSIRPIHHQLDSRIEGHIFVCFLGYCLQVTLKAKLAGLAGGLSGRAVLEKFGTMQMVDVCVPTSDGRRLEMSRYSQPDKDLKVLLMRMGLELPPQSPPRIALAAPHSVAAVAAPGGE